MQKAFEVRRDASAAWRPPVRRALSERLFKRSSFSRQVGTSLFFVFRASLSVSFGSANADRSERSPFPLNSPRSRRAQDGTYALEVGQMSDVVDSDSGLHIILRTA
jgi:NIMA-interacting peptidyl-prolyl cis-trans isomerase 1